MAAPSVSFTAQPGQAVSLRLQLLDSAGAAEDLTGRSFRWAIIDRLGATVASVAATIGLVDDISTATMRLTGTVNTGLLTGKGLAEDYRHSCIELLADDEFAELLRGPYQVRQGVSLDDLDGGDGGDASADAATVVKVLGSSGLIQVQALGATGASAAQQLYAEGEIPAATTAAMKAWLRGQGIRAALIYGG